MSDTLVNISIDTEEDDWGSYAREGAQTKNIELLPALQEIFDRWGARPTYFVNHPPLTQAPARDILTNLSMNPAVEIGLHCHPWNTPPFVDEDRVHSMMCQLTSDVNQAKVNTLMTLVHDLFGQRPTCFRAGRWGFGTTVAEALSREGIRIDSSVSPFWDWSEQGGPDYLDAPHQPYRFHAANPLQPVRDGHLVEIPVTIGAFRGSHAKVAHLRRKLERGITGRMKVVGLLDRAGFLTRRWLSPEMLDGPAMVRLAEASVRAGERVLAMTFHSCTLLPGATGFVKTAKEQAAFLQSIEHFVRHCAERGFRFVSIGELGQSILDSA